MLLHLPPLALWMRSYLSLEVLSGCASSRDSLPFAKLSYYFVCLSSSGTVHELVCQPTASSPSHPSLPPPPMLFASEARHYELHFPGACAHWFPLVRPVSGRHGQKLERQGKGRIQKISPPSLCFGEGHHWQSCASWPQLPPGSPSSRIHHSISSLCLASLGWQ